jgi:trypsin
VFYLALAGGGVSLRIIGGSEAVEDCYSYVVLPQGQGPQGHFCSGSLIARDVLLTAAHCQGIALKVMLGRQQVGV